MIGGRDMLTGSGVCVSVRMKDFLLGSMRRDSDLSLQSQATMLSSSSSFDVKMFRRYNAFSQAIPYFYAALSKFLPL